MYMFWLGRARARQPKHVHKEDQIPGVVWAGLGVRGSGASLPASSHRPAQPTTRYLTCILGRWGGARAPSAPLPSIHDIKNSMLFGGVGGAGRRSEAPLRPQPRPPPNNLEFMITGCETNFLWSKGAKLRLRPQRN